MVAKPSGLMVHRSKLSADRVFALQRLRDQLGREVHPVHRLDRPTSGCLLFALERDWIGPLNDALRAGTKRYLALVRGHIPTRDDVVVDKPLATDRGPAKPARTHFRCVASCPEPRSSVLVATPATGRFHQIRRHAQRLSHPVLGDHMHGDTRVNRAWRETRGLNRLALHCLSLDLPLPDGRLQVTCPVPDDLREVLRGLPLWAEARAAVPELDLQLPIGVP